MIEDHLSRLSDKRIFTLLDLKDGFHLIAIHPEYKYFAFATNGSSYICVYLSDSVKLLNFKKESIILQSLIRKDKVLVYVDDVFIPSTTIEEKLKTLQ